MKKLNKKTIIIMILVAVIIIVIGVVLTLNKVQKENYIEQGLWIEKEYTEVETKEDALKVLKTFCSDCEITDDIEMDGLWIFKSEEKKMYYSFNNEVKIFGELMPLDEQITKEDPQSEEKAEENR